MKGIHPPMKNVRMVKIKQVMVLYGMPSLSVITPDAIKMTTPRMISKIEPRTPPTKPPTDSAKALPIRPITPKKINTIPAISAKIPLIPELDLAINKVKGIDHIKVTRLNQNNY